MVTVRHAAPGDEGSIQELLNQLGYGVERHEIVDRLAQLSGSPCDTILVADDVGAVIGLVALHWAMMLHHSAPVARIATLVVHDASHGQGVGRALVQAGADWAREAGCGVLELTTAVKRADAHAFYKALGFEGSSLRFKQTL